MNQRLERRQCNFDSLFTNILARFAVGIDSELDADIRTSLREIAEFSRVDYAHTIRASMNQGHWSLTHEWFSPHAISRFSSHQRVPMGTWNWMERILLSGEVLKIDRLDDLPDKLGNIRKLLESVEFKSTLQVPMRGPRGQIFGCIAISAVVSEVSWDDNDVARLQLVGDVIANAMERVRLVNEVQKSEMRYRTTFEQAPAGIINFTVDGKLVRANTKFCEILGYGHDEVIDQDFSVFM